MATVLDLINDTKRIVYGGKPERMNKLAQDIASTSSDTTLTFTYDLKDIQAGHVLSINLELFYVWSVDTPGKTALCHRGYLGSTPTAHTSGATVVINSQFPNYSVWKGLNNELQSLSSPSNGLFKVGMKELTVASGASGYDLTGVTDNVLDVINVYWDSDESAMNWQPVADFEFRHNANTTDFPSGYAVIIRDPLVTGRTIRVLYKAHFSQLSSTLSTDLATTGLAPSMYDIPAIGTAARLVPYSEVRRNRIQPQGDTRRAEEVPPGAIANSARMLLQQKYERIREEAFKLLAAYPMRSRDPLPAYPVIHGTGWNY